MNKLIRSIGCGVLGTLFLCEAPAAIAQQKTFNIVTFGARGDGRTNNTQAIQQAIDKASAAGGGTVLIPAGKFLTGVIYLRSGIDLHLLDSAVLLGSVRRADYGKRTASALLEATGQQNISVSGKGIVDGQGREVVGDAFRMLKEGTLSDPDWQTENPWHQKRLVEWNRPGLIHFVDCDHVTVYGITLKDAACWVQTYQQCTNLTIDSIRVESTAYWNNDGIDVVDCGKVNIIGCFVNAGDDGICLKSHSAEKRCENVLVENCTVRSSASAIKLGTASHGGFKNINVKNISIYDTYRSAVALESVDGGTMENVTIEKIKARNTGNAFFIRLGHRKTDSPVGQVRHIVLKDFRIEVPAGKPDKGYEMEGPDIREPHNVFPASITGLPGHPLEDIVLENIEIVYEGGSKKETAHFGLDTLSRVPEREEKYPEFSMFGELPCWGLYSRHTKGLRLKNITLRYKNDEFRAAMVFDDIQDLSMNGITIPTADSVPLIVIKDSPGYDLRNNSLPFDRKKAVSIQ